MEKVIITDIDGVLLDWYQGFRLFCEKEKGIVFETSRPDNWNLKKWLGVKTSIEAEMLINEFNNDAWEFGVLPPLPFSVETVTNLAEEGYRFIAVTSCSEMQSAIKLRKANIFNHFGEIFEEIHCIPLNVSKKPYLAQYTPTIWVEDNFKNALDGASLGYTTFIVRIPHNKKYEDHEDADKLIWVNDWRDIETAIKIHELEG